jgi:hypothetical protein
LAARTCCSSAAGGWRTRRELPHAGQQRIDLDVYSYLKSVLDALMGRSTDYASLRPDRWAAAHPDAIRTDRQAERRDRYARKTARRDIRRGATTDSS